jgi:transcriptional regulator with XRE-family HTH domain
MSSQAKMSPEVKKMLDVLRSVIRGLGYNYQDVATKLGLSSGYMSRLFSGKIELKFQHIVDISRALGFEPDEIFQLAYPPGKDSPSTSALRYQMLTHAGVTPWAPPRPLSPLSPRPSSQEEELEHQVASALRKLLGVPSPLPQPAVPSEEEMEKMMERMLRRFFSGLSQSETG